MCGLHKPTQARAQRWVVVNLGFNDSRAYLYHKAATNLSRDTVCGFCGWSIALQAQQLVLRLIYRGSLEGAILVVLVDC
jgi:hypothetical protein